MCHLDRFCRIPKRTAIDKLETTLGRYIADRHILASSRNLPAMAMAIAARVGSGQFSDCVGIHPDTAGAATLHQAFALCIAPGQFPAALLRCFYCLVRRHTCDGNPRYLVSLLPPGGGGRPLACRNIALYRLPALVAANSDRRDSGGTQWSLNLLASG